MSQFVSKSFDFSGVTAEETDEEYIIEGYISTEDIDLEGDVVAKGAFNDSIYKRHNSRVENGKKSGIKFFSQHKRDQIIGYPETITEDEKGYKVSARFIKHPLFPEAAQAYYLAKMGLLDSFSVGFRAEKMSRKEVNGRKIRVIEKGDLIEFSLVSVPMNQMAMVESVKHAVEDVIDAKFSDETEIDNKEAKLEEKEVNLDIKSLTAQVEMLNAKFDAFMSGFSAAQKFNTTQTNNHTSLSESEKTEDKNDESDTASESDEVPEAVQEQETTVTETLVDPLTEITPLANAEHDQNSLIDQSTSNSEKETIDNNTNEENSQVKKGNNKHISKFMKLYKSKG